MSPKAGAAIESRAVDHQGRKRLYKEIFRSHRALRSLSRKERLLRIERRCLRNNLGNTWNEGKRKPSSKKGHNQSHIKTLSWHCHHREASEMLRPLAPTPFSPAPPPQLRQAGQLGLYQGHEQRLLGPRLPSLSGAFAFGPPRYVLEQKTSSALSTNGTRKRDAPTSLPALFSPPKSHFTHGDNNTCQNIPAIPGITGNTPEKSLITEKFAGSQLRHYCFR